MINSAKSDARVGVFAPIWPTFYAVWAFLAVLLPTSFADVTPSPLNPELNLEQKFDQAQKAYLANRTNFVLAWKFARAAFEWGDIINDRQRASVAQLGIDAARSAIHLGGPDQAEGHYYLGLNLGQLARTKSLGALRIVKEMEQEFKKAIELNPGFDFAGAYRSLGMLYAEAPGWPASIGNRAKGVETLQKAVDLHPEFPDNQISLAEVLLKAGERKQLENHFPAMQKAIESARKDFNGAEWTASWTDWDKRWQEVKQSLPQRD